MTKQESDNLQESKEKDELSIALSSNQQQEKKQTET